MGFGRAASLLAAGTLALGLGTGVAAAGTARVPASVTPAAGIVQTAVQIPTGSWVELWMPYITPTMHKCLDIPPSGVLYAQIYHCHGYASNGANQLWEFLDLGNGTYWIVNKYWGDCLNTNSPSSGLRNVHIGNCTADPTAEWHVIPSAYDPDGFLLANAAWGECAGSDTPIPSGDNSKMVRLWGCANPSVFTGDVQIQTWRIG